MTRPLALQQPLVNQYIKRILIDQNLQKWNAPLETSSKGKHYKLFKETIALE